MQPKQIDSVTKLSPEERYKYFIKKVCDNEKLFIKDSKIWPTKEFSADESEEISLEDFLEKLNKEQSIEVFPTSEKGLLIDNFKLKKDLEDYIEEWF